MQKELQKLREFFYSMPLSEGENSTDVSYVKLYNFKTTEIKMPRVEEPYLYLVIGGSMRLYTPSGIMDYIAGQYSVSAIDTPLFGKVLTFSAAKVFLAMSVSFAVNDVISVVLDIDGDLPEKILNEKLPENVMTYADENVFRSAARLIDLTDKPDSLSFMAKHLQREIIFNVLTGSCGKQFLQSVINVQQADEIYKANTWIKQNYRQTFLVEKLAERQNMSVSSFHQKFKNAVGMGPLQCQKRLRLTEARRLMLDKNINVTEASMDVGYESVSQFIRDYKKMFGNPPREDIQNLCRQLKIKAQSC